MNSVKTLKNIFVVSSVSLFFSTSHAGSFQIWEQDAANLGNYHAGAAAEGDTAGDEFYNIASITRLKKPQFSVGAALIDVGIAYSGSVTFGSQPVINVPGDSRNIVPNLHFVAPLSNRWSFAFGASTPFGLETEYPDIAPINAAATKTKLATINLNPGLAFQLNRYLSIGAGIDLLYGTADYNETLFSTTIATALSAWEWGYNVGGLLQFNDQTRLGVSYRSEIELNATGKTHNGASIFNSFADLPLPATTIISLYHDVNNRFSLMASAFYTQWSVFNTLTLHNVLSQSSSTSILENYRNTWNFALGGNYKYDEHFTFTAGLGHDQTPTRGAGYRDIRLPDNSRYIASVGLRITPKPGVRWDVGYTHLFVPKTAINNSKSLAPVITIGNAAGSINLFGLQLTYDL